MTTARKRSLLVFGFLFAGWLVVAVWQAAEHRRREAALHAALLNRAHDIANSLGVVIRSQGRFGFIPRQRLEAALRELADSRELLSLALLNRRDQVVAAGGQPLRLNPRELAAGERIWHPGKLAVADVVDLGPSVDTETTAPVPMVLVDAPPRPTTATIQAWQAWRRRFAERRPPDGGGPPGFPPPGDRPTTGGLAAGWAGRGPQGAPPPPFGGRPPWFRRGRPPWMTEEEFRNLSEKQGVHKFVLVLSTASMDADMARDLHLRLFLSAVALLAAAGLGLAWRAMARSSELELRLVRAKEQNVHLREMNIAAAGLAHETRNPLNLVRGLAQMISRGADTSPDTLGQARRIVEEVDRVTSRLNEFINYSKPREPKPAQVSLRDVIADVQRTLESDREDKAIVFSLSAPDVIVEADEPLLRQVIFNLLLNAYQASPPSGRVWVSAGENSRGHAWLEIADEGPGVPVEARENIFRPYVSLNKQGTGLGLAVVRQIVLAHHWEIEYLARKDRGATFRVSGLKVARRAERP